MYLRFIIYIGHNFLHQFEELQILCSIIFLKMMRMEKLYNSSRYCCKGNDADYLKSNWKGSHKEHHY